MFRLLFIIVPLFIGGVFIFMLAMIFSPKLRGKMMSNQVKASKYMMDESLDDLKSISDDMAYVTKKHVKSTARAMRNGFNQEKVYCKHCGTKIDIDSRFCKRCGKEQ